MQNLLFFEGPTFIGKSTYIRDAINSRKINVCSFSVQRITLYSHEVSSAVGFQVSVANSLPLPPVEIEYKNDLSGVFLLNHKKDISVLENAVLRLEQTIQARKPELIFLDEIGGIELNSPEFTKSLIRILTDSVPCVGIVKSRENLKQTISKLKLQNDYFDARNNLEELISQRGEIISIDKNNLDLVTSSISSFLYSHRMS